MPIQLKMDGNRGNDIYGEFRGDNTGWSISLSADGSVVAIGAPFHDADAS